MAFAAAVATLLVERGLGGDDPDIARRLDRFRRERSPRADDARRLARTFARNVGGDSSTPPATADCGKLVALAFPDRIAKGRGPAGVFLMANGRAAMLEPQEALAREPFLAIAEIAGRAGAARIIAAAALSAADLETVARDLIETREEVSFDRERAALRRRRSRRLGALVLSEQNLPVPGGPRIRSTGRGRNRRARTGWGRDLAAAVYQGAGAMAQPRPFLRRAEPDEGWPDLSDAALAEGRGGLARALYRGPDEPRRDHARGSRWRP